MVWTQVTVWLFPGSNLAGLVGLSRAWLEKSEREREREREREQYNDALCLCPQNTTLVMMTIALSFFLGSTVLYVVLSLSF